MFRTRKGLFIYFVISIVFITSAGRFFYIEEVPSDYEEVMQKLSYQLKYTDIYACKNSDELAVTADVEDKKTVYLTFDDGPSARTSEILDILDEYGIKATFFIVCSDRNDADDIIYRAYSSGHVIGVHSASHSYRQIYKDIDSFLKDFEYCYRYIEDITDQPPRIFRFPGGSVNEYNKNICKELVEEMNRRGFTYFDWNVSSDDATKNYTEESIYNNVINGCKNRSKSVVLMHDSANKKETVAALRRIIPYLLEQGYTFDKLDEGVQPTVFRIE